MVDDELPNRWSKVVHWIIPTAPVAQPRPRAMARVGKDGKVRVTVYKVKTIKNNNTGKKKAHPSVIFEQEVLLHVHQHWSRSPLEGPLKLDVAFGFPRTEAQQWKNKPMVRLDHDKKPDRDNCEKLLCDVLTGFLWKDDSQICAGEIRKFIVAGDEEPHIEILLSTRINF